MSSATKSKAWGGAQFLDSLDSLEGVPDWFEPRVRPEHQPNWQQGAHEALTWVGAALPGITLAALLAFLGKILADWIGLDLLRFDRAKGTPLSPIMLAILLGLIIRNTIGVPTAYEQGLRLCLRTVLRVGIVLLGLKLSLAALGQISLLAVPIVIVCIASALATVMLVGRALGLSRRLGMLIAVGTSVCGVSAIVATAPVIDAEEDETSYAVGCITLFGLLALFVYPMLAHSLFEAGDRASGIFLGTAIHDTAQVAGAGLMYKQQYDSEGVLKTAMAVKLIRNLSMALLIPLIAMIYHRGASSSRVARPQWSQMVPLFVLGFAAMAMVRTIGDMGQRSFGVLDHETWQQWLATADTAAVWCLTTAMAAVGLGTGLARLRGLGWRPLCAGLAAALAVGAVSAALILWIVPLLA
jgi:uncharacterized integral membrane protein (TIGR00698 family)